MTPASCLFFREEADKKKHDKVNNTTAEQEAQRVALSPHSVPGQS